MVFVRDIPWFVEFVYPYRSVASRVSMRSKGDESDLCCSVPSSTEVSLSTGATSQAATQDLSASEVDRNCRRVSGYCWQVVSSAALRHRQPAVVAAARAAGL
jgi:hypothetical protein